tara:strand:- start:1925 stop:2389 length:465 start_codon:yes stop_codon:yes gene_type:complete
MSYLLSHLPQSLLVAGILALIIEVAILGFASIVLFFLGLSLVLSGLLMLIGILPETLTAALWSNALITCGLALALWKPLKRLQDERQPTPINSDFARDAFVLEQDVDISGKAIHRYSGVEWKLKSQQPLTAGTTVKVLRADVGVLWVEALEQDS